MKISLAPLPGANLVGGAYLASGAKPFSVHSYAHHQTEDAKLKVSSAPELKEVPPKISWLTVAQFKDKHPAFSENSLRALIFAAKPRVAAVRNGVETVLPGNGLAVAIRRIGRRVLINENEFLNWVDQQGRNAPPTHR